MAVDIKQIDKEIEQFIKSGKYKVVDMSLFKSLDNLEISKDTLEEYSFAYDLYRGYLDVIKEFSEEVLFFYLNTLKSADVIDNQRLEKEDSFIMALYRSIQKEYAIDKLVELGDKSIITPEILKDTHSLLLKGTSSEKNNKIHIRDNNRKFVGSYKNNVRDIKYFPIDYMEIENACNTFCEHYNEKSYFENDLFIKPIILHGLIATLQLFEDGNTRLARLIEHASILNETNKLDEYDFPLPTLYTTRTYFPLRNNYRELITNLAVSSSNTDWNKWIKFNLHRIEDQIFAQSEKVKKMSKIKI